MEKKIVKIECPNCAATELVDINGEKLLKCSFCGATLLSHVGELQSKFVVVSDLEQDLFEKIKKKKFEDAKYILNKLKELDGKRSIHYYAQMFIDFGVGSHEEMMSYEFQKSRLEELLRRKNLLKIGLTDEEINTAVRNSFVGNLNMAILIAEDEGTKAQYSAIRNEYTERMLETHNKLMTLVCDELKEKICGVKAYDENAVRALTVYNRRLSMVRGNFNKSEYQELIRTRLEEVKRKQLPGKICLFVPPVLAVFAFVEIILGNTLLSWLLVVIDIGLMILFAKFFTHMNYAQKIMNAITIILYITGLLLYFQVVGVEVLIIFSSVAMGLYVAAMNMLNENPDEYYSGPKPKAKKSEYVINKDDKL